MEAGRCDQYSGNALELGITQHKLKAVFFDFSRVTAVYLSNPGTNVSNLEIRS